MVSGGVGSGFGQSQASLATVAAAMFLAGTLFEVLDALQNADYVFMICGTGPLGSTALGSNTGHM